MVGAHALCVFGAARLLRLDLATAAVASQANIGGGTLALALTRSLGRGDLELPAILLGSIGLALGNYLGFSVAGLLGWPSLLIVARKEPDERAPVARRTGVFSDTGVPAGALSPARRGPARCSPPWPQAMVPKSGQPVAVRPRALDGPARTSVRPQTAFHVT